MFDQILTAIAAISNISLSTEYVPKCLKQAVFTLSAKKNIGF